MRSMRSTALCATAAALGLFSAVAAQAASGFGTLLSGNTTTAPDSRFLGAPDDLFFGLGGQVVTYDFGPNLVVNRAGAVDFNVYEVDSGGVEFVSIDVLVSVDGSSFVSVNSSATSIVRITGDQAHGNNNFARSFDLGSLASVRYIRIDGTGTGPSGTSTAFDLDAVGAHMLAPIPEPGTWGLMAAGLLGVAAVARRRRAG